MPRNAAGTTSKIGLALAGGGPGGAVYEIGALRALEEALDGFDLNRLDVYVGVSAGAFVEACLVNPAPGGRVQRCSHGADLDLSAGWLRSPPPAT
jgi:predicted acylesterase/phospholipase RssA